VEDIIELEQLGGITPFLQKNLKHFLTANFANPPSVDQLLSRFAEGRLHELFLCL